MPSHDTTYNDQLRSAWEEFCDSLKKAGDMVFREPAPDTPLDRAAGVQYLSRQIARGLDMALEYNDPLFPNLRWNQQPTRKYGGDNPDALNLRARIDGEHTYRVTGNRGTARWVVFSIHRPHPQVPWQAQEVAHLSGDELHTEWDGSFQLLLSPDHHSGNWIKTTPDTYQFAVRQYFGDWNLEQPMTVRIEREQTTDLPPPISPQQVIAGLQGAAEVVLENTAFWTEWHKPYREQPNRFVDVTRAARALGGTPGGVPLAMYWKVQPDEVLLIEFTPPNCLYWNMELNNFWMCSIDYRYRLSGINSVQAMLEDDGLVRIAVAHQDPGIPNWIDTGGHCEGNIGLRWVKAATTPIPRTRLVKATDLPEALPPKTLRMSREERQSRLRLRRHGVMGRFRT